MFGFKRTVGIISLLKRSITRTLGSTKRLGLWVLVWGFAHVLMSCGSNEPVFSNVPEIAFVSISPSVIRDTGASSDGFTLTISYKDGDGDLGWEDKRQPDLFLIDSRGAYPINDTTLRDPVIPFNLPNLSTDNRQPSIQGTISINFAPNILFLQTPELDAEELYFTVYLLDRAGNKSNVITTPKIKIVRGF